MFITEEYLVVIENSILRTIKEVEENFLAKKSIEDAFEVFRYCIIENERSLKKIDSGILFFSI
jgi:hypothetical protein